MLPARVGQIFFRMRCEQRPVSCEYRRLPDGLQIARLPELRQGYRPELRPELGIRMQSERGVVDLLPISTERFWCWLLGKDNRSIICADIKAKGGLVRLVLVAGRVNGIAS